MWETARELLLSKELWSAIAYMILGAIFGAIISVKYSLRAHKPKLIISGGGGGGNQQKQTWRISISNRPSFLGQNLDGESARDVHALIRLDEKKSQSYFIYWGHEHNHRVTLEPGQQQSLELFHWHEGSKGYFIVDNNDESVALFQSRELKFILTLRDRLERNYEFHFTVEYDDTHLKNKPRLQIVHPITLKDRIDRIKHGLRDIKSAFRAS